MIYIKFIASVLLFSVISTVSAQVTRQKERISMVENQLKKKGIECQLTLSAMRKVPRHLFIPERARTLAYADRPIPIGYGQTISQPYIVAYMTEIIQPKPADRVLEIGTGSGYQGAVLAEIVKEVYTIEIIPELAEWSLETVSSLGYQNIHIKSGDGYYGWEEEAPFDAIVVTAASEYIPPPLVDQLKEGGRMIIPVGSPFMTQNLMLVEKIDGSIKTTSLLPVRFVPFTRHE